MTAATRPLLRPQPTAIHDFRGDGLAATPELRDHVRQLEERLSAIESRLAIDEEELEDLERRVPEGMP